MGPSPNLEVSRVAVMPLPNSLCSYHGCMNCKKKTKLRDVMHMSALVLPSHWIPGKEVLRRQSENPTTSTQKNPPIIKQVSNDVTPASVLLCDTAV